MERSHTTRLRISFPPTEAEWDGEWKEVRSYGGADCVTSGEERRGLVEPRREIVYSNVSM